MPVSKSKFTSGDLVTVNCEDSRYTNPHVWGYSPNPGQHVEIFAPRYVVNHDELGHESGYIRGLHDSVGLSSDDIYLVTAITSTADEFVGYDRSNMKAPGERLVLLTPRGLCIIASFYMKKVC